MHSSSLAIPRPPHKPVQITEEVRLTILPPPSPFQIPKALTSHPPGWGNGFLSTLVNGALGSNYGHNGATTASFVTGGDWSDVVESATRYTANGYHTYVTIQFGHNDQKNGSGVTLDQYTANLKSLASQIQALGATPILVTPLSRRNFNSSGLVIEDLATQRALTISVAQALNTSYIDLNVASTKYLDSVGKANATLFNLAPTDFTHLNADASILFGNLVSLLMTEIAGGVGAVLRRYTQPQSVIVKVLESGTFYLPDA